MLHHALRDRLPFRASPDAHLLHLLERHAERVLAHLCSDLLASGSPCQTTAFVPVPLLHALAHCARVARMGNLRAQGLEQLQRALRDELACKASIKEKVDAVVCAAMVVSEIELYVVVSDEERKRLLGIIRIPQTA